MSGQESEQRQEAGAGPLYRIHSGFLRASPFEYNFGRGLSPIRPRVYPTGTRYRSTTQVRGTIQQGLHGLPFTTSQTNTRALEVHAAHQTRSMGLTQAYTTTLTKAGASGTVYTLYHGTCGAYSKVLVKGCSLEKHFEEVNNEARWLQSLNPREGFPVLRSAHYDTIYSEPVCRPDCPLPHDHSEGSGGPTEESFGYITTEPFFTDLQALLDEKSDAEESKARVLGLPLQYPKLVKSLIKAVKYLHDQDIVHRDLRAKNIAVVYDEKGESVLTLGLEFCF